MIAAALILLAWSPFHPGIEASDLHCPKPRPAIVWVEGYTRANGTIVAGYWRTAPNNVTWDNWSSHGNVNPVTGERGYRFR